jgi:hypothetical protein
MPDEPDVLYLDPDNVRKAELCHQPPGRERVRVTVEYVSGEVRVSRCTSPCSRPYLRSYTPRRGTPHVGTRTSENTPSRTLGE